ncbi:unnamed protein product [Musa hybrid cultivar]
MTFSPWSGPAVPRVLRCPFAASSSSPPSPLVFMEQNRERKQGFCLLFSLSLSLRKATLSPLFLFFSRTLLFMTFP